MGRVGPVRQAARHDVQLRPVPARRAEYGVRRRLRAAGPAGGGSAALGVGRCGRRVDDAAAPTLRGGVPDWVRAGGGRGPLGLRQMGRFGVTGKLTSPDSTTIAGLGSVRTVI